MFGAIGNRPGELITYQPTWHHGHAVMRFIPNRKNAPTTPEPSLHSSSRAPAVISSTNIPIRRFIR